jgi:hypothetical protein
MSLAMLGKLRKQSARLSPFAHLAKSSPRDAGPTSDNSDEEKKSGPTSDNDPDDLDAGADEDGDDRENEPLDDDDEDEDEGDVKKAKRAGFSRAIVAARRQGARQERARCAAIFGSEHASGRAEQAATLAFSSRLSAREAIGILAATPRAQMPTSRDRQAHARNADTPGARLLAATQRLADRQTGKASVVAEVLAAERAHKHRMEHLRLVHAATGGTDAGKGLLAAVARLPPPQRSF